MATTSRFRRKSFGCTSAPAPSAVNFLLQGALSSACVLQVFGHAPSKPILDWGCGSGRTLRWLRPFPGWRSLYHGCDVDAHAIEWLRSACDARVEICTDDPPLPYADGTFGGLFSFSVLTHIHPHRHAAWYRELARVLEPGATALVTTQGSAIVRDATKGIPEEPRREYAERGWTYIKHEGHYKDAALVDERFTRTAIDGSSFDEIEYHEAGYSNMDTWLLRKQIVHHT